VRSKKKFLFGRMRVRCDRDPSRRSIVWFRPLRGREGLCYSSRTLPRRVSFHTLTKRAVFSVSSACCPNNWARDDSELRRRPAKLRLKWAGARALALRERAAPHIVSGRVVPYRARSRARMTHPVWCVCISHTGEPRIRVDLGGSARGLDGHSEDHGSGGVESKASSFGASIYVSPAILRADST
jgi:hypothetical protein